MIDKHLGSPEELLAFTIQMAVELDKHRKEKEPLREVDYKLVENLVMNEVRQRIDMISRLPLSKEEIAKQSVHIANYAMMLWVMATRE